MDSKIKTKEQVLAELKKLRKENETLKKIRMEHKTTLKNLREREKLGDLITSLNTRFINVHPKEIDREINRAIGKLGKFAGIDRCFVFMFSSDWKTANNTHEWCAPGIPSLIQQMKEVDTKIFSAWLGRLESFKVIHIRSVADIPVEQEAEKNLVTSLGIQSLLIVPMVAKKKLIGFLGFSSLKEEREWPENFIGLLRIVGEMFAYGIERKKSDEILLDSEARFHSLFDQIPMGLYRTDSDGRILDANPALVELLGYPDMKSLMAVRAGDIYADPEDRDRELRLLEKKGVVLDYQMQLKKYSGELIWVKDTLRALKDEHGRVLFTQGSLQDISETIKTREALEESEARFRNIIESSPLGMHMYELKSDDRFVFIDYNPAADLILGVDNSQFVGKTLGEAFPNLLKTEVPGRYREAAVEGKFWRTDLIEYEDREIKGAFQVDAFQVSQGKMVALFQDITQRKQMETALKDSEEKHRAIFESFTDVYYRTDKDGIVTIISPSVRTQAGYDPEEIVGKPVTDFYSDTEKRKTFINLLRKKGAVNDYEMKLLRKDGSIIDISASSRLIFDRNKKTTGVEGILRNITERKKADKKIQESLAEKEVMLREIHHRVKNNMQIILSLLRIQATQIDDKDMKEMFELSQNRIRAMALVHESLYKSRDLAMIDFSYYLSQLVTHLAVVYRLEERNIRINFFVKNIFMDINKAIPCGLIINELASNSIKHGFPDRTSGKIDVSMKVDSDDRIVLEVKDNGTGFPKDLDFLDTQTMGLQLVRDLILQLGGTIELSSDQGTRFRIQF
ncbi:PAS domain S-box protein [Acidobacteriota bacterium]